MTLRPAFDALLDLDEALAAVVARATEPTLAAIKLAWWRERLEELDQGQVPAEPRLRTAAAELLPRGVRGAELAQLASGWTGVLEDPPDMTGVEDRGALLFRLGARLLGAEESSEALESKGRLFAGVDIARRGFAELTAGSPGSGGPRIVRRARPLSALAALATRDLRRGGPPFEPQGTPGRSWALMRHWMTGRI